MKMDIDNIYKLTDSAGKQVRMSDGRVGTIDRTERDGTVWVWFGETTPKPSEARMCEPINLTQLELVE